MSVNYIIWNVSDDAAFRTRYEAVSGEAIQQNPSVSEDGRNYMIGSSRLSLAQADILAAEFALGFDPALFTMAVDEPEAGG